MLEKTSDNGCGHGNDFACCRELVCGFFLFVCLVFVCFWGFFLLLLLLFGGWRGLFGLFVLSLGVCVLGGGGGGW